MRLQIEKDIPVPENFRWMREERISIPWREMEPGDSVFVPDAYASGLKANASQTGKRLGLKFTVRVVPQGYRVWRVA